MAGLKAERGDTVVSKSQLEVLLSALPADIGARLFGVFNISPIKSTGDTSSQILHLQTGLVTSQGFVVVLV